MFDSHSLLDRHSDGTENLAGVFFLLKHNVLETKEKITDPIRRLVIHVEFACASVHQQVSE